MISLGGSIVVVQFTSPMASIYTRTRAEAPTFWQRNRDGIIVNAIFLVIGVGLGVATTLIFSG
jgi:hypothetical protein